jgi:hypothetical protein
VTSDESTNFWVDAPYNDRIPSLSPHRQYSTVRLSFPRPDEFSRLGGVRFTFEVSAILQVGNDAVSQMFINGMIGGGAGAVLGSIGVGLGCG